MDSKTHSPIPIVGGRGEGVPYATLEIGSEQGEAWHPAGYPRLQFKAYMVPCHTQGSVMYELLVPGQSPILFTGDTIFKAGVGRFFEGTSKQMMRICSMFAEEKGIFRADTYICPGHEYSLTNLKFAATVEPDNHHIKDELERVALLRQQHRCAVPTDIKIERLTNPFLRAQVPEVQVYASVRVHGTSLLPTVLDALESSKREATPPERIDSAKAMDAIPKPDREAEGSTLPVRHRPALAQGYSPTSTNSQDCDADVLSILRTEKDHYSASTLNDACAVSKDR